MSSKREERKMFNIGLEFYFKKMLNLPCAGVSALEKSVAGVWEHYRKECGFETVDDEKQFFTLLLRAKEQGDETLQELFASMRESRVSHVSMLEGMLVQKTRGHKGKQV